MCRTCMESYILWRETVVAVFGKEYSKFVRKCHHYESAKYTFTFRGLVQLDHTLQPNRVAYQSFLNAL
jgi:hypothetical protein